MTQPRVVYLGPEPPSAVARAWLGRVEAFVRDLVAVGVEPHVELQFDSREVTIRIRFPNGVYMIGEHGAEAVVPRREMPEAGDG